VKKEVSNWRKLGWFLFGMVIGMVSFTGFVIFTLVTSVTVAYAYGVASGQIP
jgi:hypothetical protein